ncbi:macrophage mannose receptor 1-like isoform X2 [Dreissena polymorpha]|uniref:macrophage mannose receptor 1-like isoform X1 n=1 Tax=Dreissena polymorpha TaxID=45954 RepID=UPI0022651ABF|nr:macrophage mannose receptor 1-like isoform X1 [Dreissena polymorpha]XP_052287086.1 macrophage mannose receptor 1-like isoform X2 [Dreissena polymorpha]
MPLLVAILAVALTSITSVRCDYACICSYLPDIVVYSSPDNSSSSLGHMFEFDCKATGPVSGVDAWLSVQIQNQVGYIQAVDNLQQQNCPGSISTSDIVTTSTPVTTTNAEHSSASHHTKSTTPPTATMSTETETDRTVTSPPMPTSTEETTTESTMPSMSTTATPPTTTTEQIVTTTSPPTTSFYVQTGTSMSPSPVLGVQYGCAPAFFSHATLHHGKLFTIGQTCFELVTETRTWSSAESDCKNRGGHLVHIENDDQQNKIYQIVRQYHGNDVWIGLNDKVTEEHFVWSSGHAVNYTHWYPGRKTSVPLIEEDCVAMWMTHGGQWEDVRCDGFLSNDYGYVCEFDAVVSTTTTSNPDTLMNTDGNTQSCPHMTTSIVAQFGKSCYALYRDVEVWSHAEQTCRLSGGHLVHINDAQEQQYIALFIRRHNQTTPAWIGLSDRSVEGRFVWTDGVAAAYTNWLPGRVTHGSDEDCVALLPSNDGAWDDFSCGRTNFFGSDVGEQHNPLCEYANSIASVLVG